MEQKVVTVKGIRRVIDKLKMGKENQAEWLKYGGEELIGILKRV